MPAQTLLSFRAGKMTRENETSNNVKPDLRKGYVQLLNEDELLHFQWKERSASDAEDDLIIFPDDAKFLRVAEAGDGRVYMLRFESSKAKHFFWMQVPPPTPLCPSEFEIYYRINPIQKIRGLLKESTP